MRKILASLLAASMVASLGAMSVFAADNNTKDSGAVSIVTDVTNPYKPAKQIPLDEASLEITVNFKIGEKSYTRKVTVYNTKAIPAETALNANGLGKYFDGATARFEIDSQVYTVRVQTGSIEVAVFQGTTLTPANALEVTSASVGELKDAANGVVVNPLTTGNKVNQVVGYGYYLPQEIDDLLACQALLSDDTETPYALVEGTDKLNAYDGVKSAKTVYFKVNDSLTEDDYFKLSVKKGENSKFIKAISVVEKRFNNPLYAVNSNREAAVLGSNARGTFVKVELVELTTDDEYKITFDLNVKVRKDVTVYEYDNGDWSYNNPSRVSKGNLANTVTYSAGDSSKIEDIGPIWLKNTVVSADRQFRVGEEGMMLQPVENDENEIIWYNSNDDLARLTFDADSDVDKFYSRLSTKWDHQDYATYFADQDAFLFDFIGSPKISSTSRGVLELYNPYIDEDGNETVDPDSIVIYSVVDGELYDITSSFVYDENDDGYMAFTTKTRTLGTYIFAEKPVEEASAEEVPEEVVPGNTTTDTKPVPNTGRF